jgi:NADP-dependent 3-hydroxy acid dehydrogenase YdfG
MQGVLNGIAAVLPSMLERRAGDIINISSGASSSSSSSSLPVSLRLFLLDEDGV